MENKEQKKEFINSLRIASPCTANWNKMRGDSRCRFCGACKKNVYNVEDLSKDEVIALVKKHEESGDHPPCMRLRRRHDGTVITSNCPVGLKRVRRKVFLMASMTSSFLGLSLLFTWLSSTSSSPMMGSPVVSSDHDVHTMGSPAFIMGKVASAHVMGEIAMIPEEQKDKL